MARHVVAAVDGFHDGGISVCAKHFPGHGDTSADTHLGPARVTASMTTLTERELVPFAAAIDAGVDAVLTAHIVADALDDRARVAQRAVDASTCARRWGSTASIITDALDMDAVAEGRGDRRRRRRRGRALCAPAPTSCASAPTSTTR